MAGGQGANKIGYSTDGFNWQASSNASSIIDLLVYAVDWDGTKWIAGGLTSNKLAISYDGDTWSATTNGNTIFNDRVRGIATR